MSQLPSVWFCPKCGSVSYSKAMNVPPNCCPDSSPEFVTEETAKLARIGFFVDIAFFESTHEVFK